MYRRIFYVIYFDNQRLQTALDAMRFIANPKEKTRAHITVRGPYRQPIDICSLEKKIEGTEVVADGVDGFFYENQNTVFLRCDSEKIGEIWKKKDFGFNPHITIYDGASREFAKKLLDRLERLPIRFQFVVGKLSRLETTNRRQYTMWLQQSFDGESTGQLVKEPLRVSEVRAMRSEERVSLIEAIARKLPEVASYIGESRQVSVHSG